MTIKNVRVFLTLQWKELEEDKWYESERAHRDVGEMGVLEHWCRNDSAGTESHAERNKKAYILHEEEILEYCTQHCVGPDDCPGPGKCVMPMDTLHELYQD